MNIGETIYNLRVDQSLTQEELANKVGCRYQHILRIEKGLTKPKFEDVVSILETLNHKVIIIEKERASL